MDGHGQEMVNKLISRSTTKFCPHWAAHTFGWAYPNSTQFFAVKQTDFLHTVFVCILSSIPIEFHALVFLCQSKLSACKVSSVSKCLGNLNIYNLSICSNLQSYLAFPVFPHSKASSEITPPWKIITLWIFFFKINKYDAPWVRRNFFFFSFIS